MPEIEITTVGAAILGVSAPLTVFLWKRLPAIRRAGAAKGCNSDIAVLAVEIANIKEDIAEIKQAVKELNEKYRR